MQQRPDPEAIAAFRGRALPFRAVDHETTPAVLLALAGLAVVLVAVILGEGRVHLGDGQTLTPQAWLAVAAVFGLAVLAAIEAGAWLLSRPIGRDLARAVSGVERAHRRVERMSLGAGVDPSFDEAAARIELARIDLGARLSRLDGALVTIARLPDARVRAAQLDWIRGESAAVDRAAAAYGTAAQLLRRSATSPWELTHAETAAELEDDLARAERLERTTR
ncbi:MAG: hypothetical protein U0869_08920 [Chloroflexota bacterium]